MANGGNLGAFGNSGVIGKQSSTASNANFDNSKKFLSPLAIRIIEVQMYFLFKRILDLDISNSDNISAPPPSHPTK